MTNTLLWFLVVIGAWNLASLIFSGRAEGGYITSIVCGAWAVLILVTQ